ncbi:MAG: hypothetical protein NTY29_00620 [Proteobacteria bacterium]|nr:hypothetical protein [Pseudomonadota bacterium]
MLDIVFDDYYALCGWDNKTGIPTKERFICMVLEDISKAYG